MALARAYTVSFVLLCWGSCKNPHDAEAGGGLMVAVVQLAIALGATAGGFIYDTSGYRSTFTFSAVVLCASALVAWMGWRVGHQKLSADGSRETSHVERSST
jgi:predicted MFS family arabinose efflux permease